MRYYLIAGEASGDLHGGRLVQAIRSKDASAVLRGWGGEQMQKAGATIVTHYRELAFMGFAEVIKNLPTILRNLRRCKKDILAFAPDVLVLIDYPGFNLTVAPWAKKRGYKIAYYISPQVWAWKEGRVPKMKACIDRLLVILPFEKDYYRQRWNWEVDYVGHPLIEAIESTVTDPPLSIESPLPLIAVLPGSRKQEIEQKLPIMLSVSPFFNDHQWVVAMAPGLSPDFYASWQRQYPQVRFVTAQTYALLRQAKAALVTSGTATLETALLGVPQVVCYKGSALSYEIGKRVVKIKYISLVNLILDQPLVQELIQYHLTTEALVNALRPLLVDSPQRTAILNGYDTLRMMLRQEAPAATQAAGLVVELAKK